MEKQERNPIFDPLRNLALEIDRGMMFLEKNLANPSSMLPCEDHAPRAVSLMEEVVEELQLLAQKASSMKLKVKHIAADIESSRTEALNTMEQMDEDFALMEKALQPFGYTPFSAAEDVPARVSTSESTVETDASVSAVGSNLESTDENDGSVFSCSPGHSSKKFQFSSSTETIDPFEENEAERLCLDGSYTNVEDDQGVGSEREGSLTFRQPAVISRLGRGVSNAAAPCNDNLLNLKRHLSMSTPSNEKLFIPEQTMTDVVKPKPFTRPKKVIYSKETYAILGIDPPPEFYAQQSLS